MIGRYVPTKIITKSIHKLAPGALISNLGGVGGGGVIEGVLLKYLSNRGDIQSEVVGLWPAVNQQIFTTIRCECGGQFACST